jgi:hypothetical protein
MSAKRQVLLIGCPGKEESYLKGVREDLSNMKGFLMSERGGKFYPAEIKTLVNPKLTELFDFHNTQAKYQVIYYSGHGYTDPTGKRMLCLQNCPVSDTYFLSRCPCQLIIIDACRTFAGAVEQLLTDVRYELQTRGSLQAPRIVHKEGDLQIPFAVAMHQAKTIPDQNTLYSIPTKPAPNSLAAFLILGLVILVVANN